MEFAAKIRWILVVGILLFILIFVGWGLSAIARSVFGGSETAQTDTELVQAVDLGDSRVVRYIVEGPTVASSEHRSYAIEITRNIASMKVYSDYGQKIVAEKSYTNNTEAFDTFIKSLENANATARYTGTDVEDDFADQGVCPTGRTYVLEIDQDVRRWTTSCDRKQGTAAGKMTTMRDLFSKQIPDFSDLLKDTTLGRQ